MSYCKIFGMHFIKDPYSKTVDILTRNSFYARQEKLDWSYKLDYSRPTDITPLGWDYKTGVFKWENLGTKYEEDYSNRTNREYGSMRFNTGYSFNDDEKNYLEEIIFNNCIIATDYSKYYRGRVSSGAFEDTKALPHLQNSDGSKVDINFILVFKDGYQTLDTPISITDDDNIMNTLGFCWNNNADNIRKSYSYPRVVRYINPDSGPSSLNFGRPSIAYNQEEAGTANDNPEIGTETLYTKFWKGYLADRFSQEAKILTAYFNINLIDIDENLFNKFIYINNSLWIINKIHSFDPLKKRTTKIDLLSVQDISSYVSQKYIEGQLTITRDGVVLYDSTGDTGTASSPIVIRVDSSSQTIVLTLDSSIEWQIGDIDEDTTVTPLSADAGTVDLSITIPDNESGSATTNTIPILWGSTTTIIQIVQVSNWSVTISSNVGEATANGETANIQVSNGDSVTFETTGIDGYGFGYWIINNQYYFSQRVTLSIEDNTEAMAYWYDLTTTVKMSCNDEYTGVSNVSKIGSYWFLNLGQTYTFVNNQSNLSGYLFDDDSTYTSPSASVSREIAATDTSLIVFYDTLLLNLNVVNNSATDFDISSIIITSPSCSTISSPSGSVSAGNEESFKYAYETSEYGTYTFSTDQVSGMYVGFSPSSADYQRGSDIATVSVTVSDLKWEDSSLSVIADGGTVSNTLSIPSNLVFTIQSDVSDITISPDSGAGSRTVSVSVPANTGGGRTITITASIYDGATVIDTQAFTITQASGLFQPELSLSTYITEVNNAGTIYTIYLYSNTTWELSSNSSWLSAVPYHGDGDQDITVSVLANTDGNHRTGVITFSTTYGANDVSVNYTVEQQEPQMD